MKRPSPIEGAEIADDRADANERYRTYRRCSGWVGLFMFVEEQPEYLGGELRGIPLAGKMARASIGVGLSFVYGHDVPWNPGVVLVLQESAAPQACQ